jgi:hypothetical protein
VHRIDDTSGHQNRMAVEGSLENRVEKVRLVKEKEIE